MTQINPRVSAEQKKVLFDKATEAPFSGKFLHNDKTGQYTCANCGAELFDSATKFESTMPGLVGWPSFSDVAKKGSVKLLDDTELGVHRQEVVCAKCGGHLGHLFDDGASDTGQHYCINSLSLDFKPSNEASSTN